MAWFKKKDEAPPPEEPVEVIPLVIEGNRPCSEEGCTAVNGAPCSYVDRRQRECPTAWCPEHQVVIDARCFCRRHANTLDAIKLAQQQGFGLPDVTNRVPTLVRWIDLHVNEDLRAMLSGYKDPSERYGHTVVHPVRNVDGQIRWMSTWQLFDQTGSAMRITVEVAEAEPTTVNVRVGQAVVYSEIPPWIMHREKHEDVDPDIDQRERAMFYHLMLDAVKVELAKQRTKA